MDTRIDGLLENHTSNSLTDVLWNWTTSRRLGRSINSSLRDVRFSCFSASITTRGVPVAIPRELPVGARPPSTAWAVCSALSRFSCCPTTSLGGLLKHIHSFVPPPLCRTVWRPHGDEHLLGYRARASVACGHRARLRRLAHDPHASGLSSASDLDRRSLARPSRQLSPIRAVRAISRSVQYFSQQLNSCPPNSPA